jgi:hypothetical protein
MKQARQTEDDLRHIRQLMDAGHRGRPIGGEVLVALGAVLAVLCALQGLTAFSFLPLSVAPSPLAAAAAFLAFVVFAMGGGGQRGAARIVLPCLAAGLAGELVWRGVLYLMRTDGTPDGHVDTSTLWAVTGLLGLAVLAGLFAGAVMALRRLSRNPAAQSPANRIVTGGWLAVLAAFAVVLALNTMSGLRSGDWMGLNLVPGLFWCLWGIGWWISALATRRRWMMWVVAGSWIEALWFVSSGEIYAGTTVGFVALAVLPGLKLLADDRHATNEA